MKLIRSLVDRYNSYKSGLVSSKQKFKKEINSKLNRLKKRIVPIEKETDRLKEEIFKGNQSVVSSRCVNEQLGDILKLTSQDRSFEVERLKSDRRKRLEELDKIQREIYRLGKKRFMLFGPRAKDIEST